MLLTEYDGICAHSTIHLISISFSIPILKSILFSLSEPPILQILHTPYKHAFQTNKPIIIVPIYPSEHVLAITYIKCNSTEWLPIKYSFSTPSPQY